MCTSFFLLCRTSCPALSSVTPRLCATWVRDLRLRLPSWSTSPSSVPATQQSCTSILSSWKYTKLILVSLPENSVVLHVHVPQPQRLGVGGGGGGIPPS